MNDQPTNNSNIILKSNAQTFSNALNSYCQIIESIIKPEDVLYLKRQNIIHPALSILDICKMAALKSQRDEEINLSQSEWSIITRATLDAYAISTASSNNETCVDCSQLANYGDTTVQKRIRGIAKDPDQFGDLMTEIRFASMCVVHGLEITATEENNHPDLLAYHKPSKTKMFIECKQLNSNQFAKAIKNDLKDANRKIKLIDDSIPGLVALDASNFITDSLGTSDNIPKSVHDIAEHVKNCLQRDYKSISTVYIMWNSHRQAINEEKTILINFEGLHSMKVHHKVPRVPFPENDFNFEPYIGASSTIRKRPSSALRYQ